MSPHTRCVIEGIDTNTVICGTMATDASEFLLLHSTNTDGFKFSHSPGNETLVCESNYSKSGYPLTCYPSTASQSLYDNFGLIEKKIVVTMPPGPGIPAWQVNMDIQMMPYVCGCHVCHLTFIVEK